MAVNATINYDEFLFVSLSFSPGSGQSLLCLPPAKQPWMPGAAPTASDTAWTSPAWATASSSTTRTLTGAQVISMVL